MLNKNIEKVLSKIDGTWGICAQETDTGKVIFKLNENRPFAAASVGKLYIALYVLHAIDKNLINKEELMPLVEEYKLGGSGILKELTPNIPFKILDIVKFMLIISDNTAAKLLVKKFTPQKINSYLEELGFKVTRLTIDGDKFGFGMTTPKEISELLMGVYNNKYFSEELSKLFLQVLKSSTSDLGIRRLLPHDRYKEDVKLEIANKGGSIPGVRNDVGIIFDKKPYVLSIMANDLKDESYKPDNKGWIAIAKISKEIYKNNQKHLS